jgi:hypothetical protein
MGFADWLLALAICGRTFNQDLILAMQKGVGIDGHIRLGHKSLHLLPLLLGLHFCWGAIHIPGDH